MATGGCWIAPRVSEKRVAGAGCTTPPTVTKVLWARLCGNSGASARSSTATSSFIPASTPACCSTCRPPTWTTSRARRDARPCGRLLSKKSGRAGTCRPCTRRYLPASGAGVCPGRAVGGQIAGLGRPTDGRCKPAVHAQPDRPRWPVTARAFSKAVTEVVKPCGGYRSAGPRCRAPAGALGPGRSCRGSPARLR